jgi:hypothetical protein
MSKLIQFSGYDPDEDDFDGVEMAPLHDDELRQYRTSIDVARAWELKHAGATWAEVGRIIALEMGRPIRFQETSIANAATRCKPAKHEGLKR